eukprot:gene1856-2191_t
MDDVTRSPPPEPPPPPPSPPPPNPPYPPIPQTFQGFQLWCNPRTQYTGNSLFCYFGFYLTGAPRSNTFCCAKLDPSGPNANLTACGVQNPTVSITLNSPRAGTDVLTAVCCDQSTPGVNDFDTCKNANFFAAGGPKMGESDVGINWLAAPPPPPRPPR